MTRRVPERTCIACRRTGGKRGFCRIVRTPEGELLVDRTGKRSGRGAYVHPDAGCVREALKGERLARALRTQVTSEDKVRLEADLTHLVARAELLEQLSRIKGDATTGSQAPPGEGEGARAGVAVARPAVGRRRGVGMAPGFEAAERGERRWRDR